MPYRFEGFELDTSNYELRLNGATVPVEPKVLDVLAHLVAHHDHVVTKEELLDAVWGDRFVSDTAVTSCVKAARRTIGDDGKVQRLIRTVHRRGYRFVGDVSSSEGAGSRDRQTIRFCFTEDGTRLAYATTGTGPPLMKAANWMSHLDLEWTTAIWSHWLHGLAQRRQLIRYDERGCGLSDWDVGDFTFDDWVKDLETVVEAVGLERFPLLGVSQGGAVAIDYAVRHPERVSHLILAGAYGRGRLARAGNDQERREAAIDLELAQLGWSRDEDSFLRVFASQFLPLGTAETWNEFVEFQRSTTSTENAVRFLKVFAEIDVADVAAAVSCPTLIVHSRHDVRVPLSQATELASAIPDSRLVILDSPNHLLVQGEPAWPEFLAQIDEFLGRS